MLLGFFCLFPVIYHFFALFLAEAESSDSSKAGSDSSGESADSSEYELSSEEEDDEDEEQESAAQNVEEEGKRTETSSSSSSSTTSSSDEGEEEAETRAQSSPVGLVPEDKEDQRSREEISSKLKSRPPSPKEEVEDLKPPSPKGIPSESLLLNLYHAGQPCIISIKVFIILKY